MFSILNSVAVAGNERIGACSDRGSSDALSAEPSEPTYSPNRNITAPTKRS